MRLQSALLLVACVLLTSSDATMLVKTTNANLRHPNTVIQDSAHAQRFLWAGDALNDEERGAPVILEKVKALLTTSKTTEQTLAHWAQNNKSPKKALIRLNLYNAGDQFFKKAEFQKWVKYVTMLNKQNPEAAMLSTLMTRYTDDALYQMIIAAKKVSSTETIATKLQAEQVRVWLSNGKSAKDVFGIYQLTKAGNKLLDNPQFTAWINYVDDLSKHNVEKANTMMATTLARHYSDEALATMVAAARKFSATENVATKVEAAQIQSWLSYKLEPVDVFKLIKLDKAGAGLLTNPKLNTWVNFLNAFNVKNPRAKTTMVKTFTTYYGDEGLATMLIAAKNVDTTKKMATDLQHAQLSNWLLNKADPRNVFRWMGVKGTAEDGVERALYRKYLKDFNSMYVGRRRRLDNTASLEV